MFQLTDEKMLTSEPYRRFLQNLVRTQSGNYTLQVRFGQWPKTDGKTIWLLPDAEEYDGLDLSQRTLCVIGNLAHEFFHIRWTDFQVIKKLVDSTQGSKRHIVKEILNILEDSFIEHVGLEYYTGYFHQGILAKNDVLFKLHPSQEELAECGVDQLEMALAAMLEDAKYHRRKSVSPNEEVELWFQHTRSLWLEALVKPTTEERLSIAFQIYETLLPWVNQSLKSSSWKHDDDHSVFIFAQNSPEPVDPSILGKILGYIQGLDQKGETLGVKTDLDCPISNETGEMVEWDGVKADSEEGDFNVIDRLNNELENLKQEVKKEETERAEKTERVQQWVHGMHLSDCHRGIRILVNEAEISDRMYEEYDTLRSEIKGQVAIAARLLKEKIRSNEDWKKTGLQRGRINQSALYRKDGRIFYQRIDKSEQKDLLITLLIDESGSMDARVGDVIKAGIFFMELAQAMNIPCAVFGHKAAYGRSEVELSVYRYPEDPARINARILSMRAVGGTRDGVAMAWLDQFLSSRLEKDKIMICLTDGEPHHYAHNGDPYLWVVREDTISSIQKLRKQATVIGLCVGDEAKSVKELYEPLGMTVPEVSQLGKAFVRIVERNLLR